MENKNSYAIENGKIKTRSLEAHIVDHCNLRCEGCCSLSPLLPTAFTSPQELSLDLALASQVLAPTWFKLVGGEPLLHPDIVECIKVAKESGIAPIVSVTTNGLLLPKMSDEFWQSIDALTISLYPNPPLPEKTMALTIANAAKYNVHLNWKKQDHFVQMDRPIPSKDRQVNQQVFDDCWLRRRCHLIRAGRFFTCTRPVHYQTLAESQGHHADFITEDGIALDARSGLLQELHAYLTQSSPLLSCARCKGGNAEQKPHRQMTISEIRFARKAMACI